MSNSAPGFASRPDYRVDLLPESRRIKVVFGGATIADTGSALRVEETGHGPVYYIAGKRRAARPDASDRAPHPLPLQGRSLVLDDRIAASGGRSENAVWGYP